MTHVPPHAVHNGHIKRITDADIQSSVLEICSSNVSTTFISCPADPAKTLGIKLPFLVMIIKNLKKYFSFEVQVLDDKNVRRRFRASNYQVQGAQQGRVCLLCYIAIIIIIIILLLLLLLLSLLLLLLCPRNVWGVTPGAGDVPTAPQTLLLSALLSQTCATHTLRRAPLASSRSSAQCQCGWMRDGTRSSSTWQTLHGAHMVRPSCNLYDGVAVAVVRLLCMCRERLCSSCLCCGMPPNSLADTVC